MPMRRAAPIMICMMAAPPPIAEQARGRELPGALSCTNWPVSPRLKGTP